jgi:Squalene-hopene cyclase C-terminal domain
MSRGHQHDLNSVQERSFELHVGNLAEPVRGKSLRRVPLDLASAPSKLDRLVDDPKETASHSIVIQGREFKLMGNSLLCKCPDCAAPMTVRLWLGLGDCWRCSCSISLNDETLETLQALVGQKSVSVDPQPERPLGNLDGVEIPKPLRQPSIDFVEAAAPSADSRLSELVRLTRPVTATQMLTNFLNSLPAWFISFLLHLFLILVMALFVYRHEAQDSISLVMSTFLDRSRTEGGTITLENTDRQLADDLLPEGKDEGDSLDETVLDAARREAQSLTVDPEPVANLPELAGVKQKLAGNSSLPATFAARDPRLRQEIVEKEGGTTLSEAAVSRGLRWLASVQNEDGSWSLANYNDHKKPRNRGDSAATSLALLPFLGAGQTHEFGIYKSTVTRGLAWLMKNQKSNGDLRANFPGQAGMYAHGQATICLCEAYALTGDERFREPSQNAIRFIENAQHQAGGWRYEPKQPGDTSVFGWQLMALQSARAANLGVTINKDTLRLADYYLDTVSLSNRVPNGALYRYQPNEGEFTAAMTAEGILCRMYLGWKRDDPRMMYAIKWLLRNHLPRASDANIYYWYYGTQALHHYGGTEWERWNNATRDLVISMQQTKGRHPGSWNPDDFEWGQQGERIFVTSMAICILEVYYRHLPLFKPIDLGSR